MRPAVGLLTCLCFSAVSWADGPSPQPTAPQAQQSAAPVAPSSSQPATASSPAAAPAPAATPATAATPSAANAAHTAKPDDLTPDEKRLLSEGWRLERRSDGQKYFCRKEVVLGSNLPNKVCGTSDQLAQSRLESRDLADRLQQRHGTNPQGN